MRKEHGEGQAGMLPLKRSLDAVIKEVEAGALLRFHSHVRMSGSIP